MPVELTFTAALLVGLLGSATHCVGMCGGIVSALNMGVGGDIGQRPRILFGFQLAYNLGRITSYVAIGALAGQIGEGLAGLGVSPLAGRLFAAGFMIALGLYLANWWRGLAALENLGTHLWRHIQPLGQRLFPIHSPAQAFLLGGLWGWLPCGLVYATVAWSLTTASPWQAAILMLGFGLGTLPAMLLAGNAFQYLKQWVQSPVLRRCAGVLIIAFGIYSAISGLSHAHHAHHTDLSSTSTAEGASGSNALMRVPASLRRVS